jgi:hypothetical protein
MSDKDNRIAADEFHEMVEQIRQIIRARLGLSADEDLYAYLLNMRDEREKARLTEHNFYGHSAMRVISHEYPEELGYWKDIALMEDVYSIALEGEGRKEGILMANAKRQETMPVAINLPSISTQPAPQQPQPKKHWWNRGGGQPPK